MVEGSLLEILHDNSHFEELVAAGHYEALSKIILKAEDECVDYDTYAERPYYRLRGKRVTEEQAEEIISRTDDFICDIVLDNRLGRLNIANKENYLSLNHLRNLWLVKKIYPTFMGWIHPNGIVGGNGITDEYPTFGELLADVIDLKLAFPYLEFIWALSRWDEMPSEEWDKTFTSYYEGDENYPNFNENIEIVFHLHDDMIEVLGEENGTKRYKEMLPIYEEGVNDPYVYTPSYYYRKKENPVSREFLKRSLEAYGLTLEYHDNLKNGSWLPQNK